MHRRIVIDGLFLVAVLVTLSAGCGAPSAQPPPARTRGTRIAERPAESEVGSYYSNLIFSPDGKALVLVTHDGVVKLRDLTTGKAEDWPEPHNERHRVDRVAYLNDGRLLAVACRARDIIVWDIGARKERIRIALEGAGVHDMVFMDGDKTLSVILGNGTGDPLALLMGTNKGHDLAVRWDVSSGERRGGGDLGNNLIIHEVMAPNGRYAVFRGGHHAKLLKEYAVFDLISGARCFDVKGGGYVFSRNGSIRIACEERGLWLREVASGKVLRHFNPTLSFNLGWDPHLSVSDDGKLLAVSRHPNANLASLISLESGELLDQVECGPPSTVCDVALLSPDGRILATQTDGINQRDRHVDPLLRSWNLPTSW